MISVASVDKSENSHTWQRLLALFLCLALIILLFSDVWDEPDSHEFTGSSMGTWYTIKLQGVGSDVDIVALKGDIHAHISMIEQLMSTYQRDSELTKINQLSAGSDWIELSPQLADVLSLARAIHQDTSGLFDPTLKPVVDLWGFGPVDVGGIIPAEAQINESLRLKDFSAIVLEQRNNGATYLQKKRPVTLDLSAIAKGYAVDRVAEYLTQEGIVNYLIEIGGEIRVSGVKADGSPWRVAIESPIVNRRSVFRVIEPEDYGVATSGDYRNHRMIEGKRYGHVIDPESGWPVRHDTVSVTVVDRSVARADALATALLVMGKERAIAWANKHNQPVFCIYRTEFGFASDESDSFETLFGVGAKADLVPIPAAFDE